MLRWCVQAVCPEERAVAVETGVQRVESTLRWLRRRRFMTAQQLQRFDSVVCSSLHVAVPLQWHLLSLVWKSSTQNLASALGQRPCHVIVLMLLQQHGMCCTMT